MNSNTYLAEISSRELRELNSDISIQVGAEYDITKAADTLATLRSLNTSKLKNMSNQIKDLEKKFNEIQDSYDALMLLDVIKHSGDQ